MAALGASGYTEVFPNSFNVAEGSSDDARMGLYRGGPPLGMTPRS